MTDVPATVTVLLIEIAAATTALSLFVAAAGWRRWRKRRAVVVTLVKNLKQSGEKRLAQLQQLLMAMGTHDATAASTLAEGILRLETKLYQHLVAGLVDVTGKPLLSLDQHVEAFVNEFVKIAPVMIDSVPMKVTTAVESQSASDSVTDGLARLERDNAELKSAVHDLRTELRNLLLRPTAPSHYVEANVGEQEGSSTHPAPHPQETTNLGVQELDLDLSSTMSPSSDLDATSSFNSESTNSNKPSITHTQNTEAILPDTASADDGIASMPDDWLNQPIDTTTDLSKPSSIGEQDNDTEPSILDSPHDTETMTSIAATVEQADSAALDEIYAAASEPTKTTEHTEPEKAVIPVEIDPDAFLDSLLNDAKETSLNVIASTNNTNGEKAANRSMANGPANNSTVKTLDKKETRPAPSEKTNTNKQANSSNDVMKKEPSPNKSQLEAELEDLLS